MQIRNYFTLAFLLFSSTAFTADTIQMFSTKAECLRHFTLSSGTSDATLGERFCANRVVAKSPLDICAERKLLDFKMKNSISSAQEAAYLANFKKECSTTVASAAAAGSAASTQLSARDAQIAQQQAQVVAQQQAAAAQKAAADAAAAKKAAAAAPQQAQAQQQANALKELAAIADKSAAGSAKDTAVRKTEPSATAAVERTQASPLTGPGPSGTSEDVGKIFVDKEGNVYQRTGDMGNDTITKIDPKTGLSTDEINSIPSDAVRVDASSPPGALDGKSVTGPMPELEKSVANAEKAAGVPSTADGGQGPITAAATEKTAEEKTEITTSIEQLKPTLTMHVPASIEPFPATVSGLDAVKAKFESFASSTKPNCVKLAETSSFLCVEAPGAKAAKDMMDVAGPVLAAVGSIQKACSNTANVTGLASKLLTIAKGTCVAAKTACDAGCAAASAAVKEMTGQLKTLEGTIAADLAKAKAQCLQEANAQCASATVGQQVCTQITYAGCETNVNMSAQKAKAIVTKLTTTISKETAPSPEGSVASTQAKCTMNAKDIAGLAINALSTMKAMQDAKECDRKLASSGDAGGSVTPTQFCESPANSSSGFCKCQQNSNQQGCPGFAGTGALVDKTGSVANGAGTNQKNGAGVNSFAGGSKGILNPFGNNGQNGKANTNPADGSSGEKLSLSGDGSGGNSAGGVGGASGGSGGGVDGGAGDAKGGGDKKWSFGSFANALGGMFGGGGKAGKGAAANGSLNSKQAAAIKRKLASDKLAGEITSASGKSNWEKVHQVYLIKDNTLLTGN